MAGDTASRGGGGENGGGAAEKKKAKKEAAAEDVRLERLLRCGAYEVGCGAYEAHPVRSVSKDRAEARDEAYLCVGRILSFDGRENMGEKKSAGRHKFYRPMG